MKELLIDSFAGGGGASTGIEMALGRSPDYALDHDAVALGVHAANHPKTKHLVSNIWKAEPEHICQGLDVGLLWASPDCKGFSKAKGGKPVDKNIRGLAGAVVMWALTVKPRLIMLENVEEFQDAGPLMEDNRPCPNRKGEHFKSFIKNLRQPNKKYGKPRYRVEWRELRGCDYGSPTIRKRLFVIARRDGKPIVWPKPTHGKPDSQEVLSGKLLPWPAAADCIDWSRPCPSIFATAKQIWAQYGIRAIRPLADATMARIARGVERYVINATKPFIVPVVHTGDSRVYPIDEPHRTITCAHRGEQALVMPSIVGVGSRAGQSPPRAANEPLATVTATKQGMHAVVSPVLINTANSKTTGRGPNTWPIDEPARTVTSSGTFAIATPFVTKFNRGATGHAVDEPLHTITSAHSDTYPGGATPLGIVTPFLAPRYQEKPGQEPRTRSVAVPAATIVAGGNVPGMLVAPMLSRQFGNSVGSSVEEPAPTVMPNGGGKTAIVAVHLEIMRNSDKPFSAADEPVHTVTAGGARIGVVAAFLAQHNGGMVGHSADEPVSTIVQKGPVQAVVSAGMISMKGSDRRTRPIEEPTTTQTAGGWHQAEVRAFLIKYFGTDQDPRLDDPLHTVTTKARFGIVTVHGEPYQIVDIGMRMLTPRELFRAQGFPESFIIDRTASGEAVSKTDQIRLCGNSVCPRVAAALVRANYVEVEVSDEQPIPAFELAAE